jgi:hypothetical protein
MAAPATSLVAVRAGQLCGELRCQRLGIVANIPQNRALVMQALCQVAAAFGDCLAWSTG